MKEYNQRPEVKERAKEYRKEYEQRPEVKERMKEYYRSPKYKERKKEYEQRPEVKERRKEYYQRPEVKERMKEYYQSPKYKERKKEYEQRPEVRERRERQRKRKDNFESPYFSDALHRAKVRAKEKFPDKLFNITTDYLKEIFPHEDRRCPVLNLQLKINSNGKGSTPNSPSLDRIENDKGYEIGNVIWVCNKVNTIKNNSTPDEIIKVGKFYKELEKNVEV